jgi:SAM-dependent methyltransferase
VILLVRHRDALSGRVLELGCGAGRLTGYLGQLAAQVRGIDVSPAMLEYCRQHYPEVTVEQRDLRDLGGFDTGSFDAVVGGFNVIDVLSHDDRLRLLAELHRIVAPGGMVVLSSHNRAAAGHIKDPMSLRHRGVLRAARTLARLPRWLSNRRRLLPFEREESGYAILNDASHDFAALHYYITRDAQERQLAVHGFQLLECLDGEGRPVPPGAQATESSELHYVARSVEPLAGAA